MKLYCSILISLLTLSATAQKGSKNKDRFAGFDTAMARVLKQWKIPGFAVAVVEKNKVVYAKGFGYKDLEAKQPVTTNTQFAIGSCTKAFTAAVLGVLAKDGKVDIDKPVREYLPELKFYNNDMNNNITLRDMMTHRTGISRYDYSWYFFPAASSDSLIKRIQFMEPSEPLRKKWQYNNFMYMAQGVLAEKITGKSWERNVEESFLKPLGMSNTNLGLADWMQAPDYSKGYRVNPDGTVRKLDYYNIAAMAPAGSINSSVNDMAKWLMMWINAGKYEGKEILPSPYVSEAISSQMVTSAGLPGAQRPDVHFSTYGFGWMLSSYRGHYRVEHGGNIDGFSASASFFPSDSVGIVVLTNEDGSAVPNVVRNLIADRMLNLSYTDWQTKAYREDTALQAKQKQAMASVVADRKPGTKMSHTKQDYTGLYKSVAQEQFEVILQNDSLFVLAPREKLYMHHYHYDVFNLWDKEDQALNDESASGLKVMFHMNEKGEIVKATMQFGPEKPTEFVRADKAKPMSKDSLQKYVGEYSISSMTAKVYIKGDQTLYLFVPGQPEYELMPIDRHKFKLTTLDGFSVEFKGNGKGEISELVFIQPNGSFKATRVIKLAP
ncbi:MAG: serine hydrolase [Chitinophagaceae bacterium]|nr:MAG: serine hydrolase [Chitinophagaceae bacterium]